MNYIFRKKNLEGLRAWKTMTIKKIYYHICGWRYPDKRRLDDSFPHLWWGIICKSDWIDFYIDTGSIKSFT